MRASLTQFSYNPVSRLQTPIRKLFNAVTVIQQSLNTPGHSTNLRRLFKNIFPQSLYLHFNTRFQLVYFP